VAEIALPKIGDIITPEWGLLLCVHFGFDHLARRIRENPGKYKPWRFDGVSCVPDMLLQPFVGNGHTWEDITYKCALQHDLPYAYGEPGNEEEKQEADDKFRENLIIHAGMDEKLADIFEKMVETFGKEKFHRDYTWAFALKEHYSAWAN